MGDPQLITIFKFDAQDYLIKLFTKQNISLELSIMNKFTRDEWHCCYEASYVEGLTQKTGNFKQFDVFVTMLKAGLLKTSECISLALLTFDDLKNLRNRKCHNFSSRDKNDLSDDSNKRYLILTYSVEFDKIHYPLPLNYIGPPDPKVQQQIIYKLESEVSHLKQLLHKNSTPQIKQIIIQNDMLKSENLTLKEQLKYNQNTNNSKQTSLLQRALKDLEESVLTERESHHCLVQKLRMDNLRLTNQLCRLRKNEKILISKLRSNIQEKSISPNRVQRTKSNITTNTTEHLSRNKSYKLSRAHSLSPKPKMQIFERSRPTLRTFQKPNKSTSCCSYLLTNSCSSGSNISLTKSKIDSPTFISKTGCSLMGSTLSRKNSTCSQRSQCSSYENKDKNPEKKRSKKKIINSVSIEQKIKNLQNLITRNIK